MRVFLLLLLVSSGPLMAQTEPLHLDVNGEISIDARGAVSDCRIYTVLTPQVEKTVVDSVRRWTFEPVVSEGIPVPAKSGIWLTLAASPEGDGFRLRVEKVRFLGNRKPLDTTVPPRYPKAAQRASISAAVLVAVRVDAAGDVMDAFATQSTLFGPQAEARAREAAADRWRRSFEEAAVAAAKQWKFRPADPASGEVGETTLLMPIEYRIGDVGFSAEWRSALASPISPIPWLPAEKQAYDPTGLRQGGSLALDGSIKLRQDVAGSAL